jgi:very-short-patch-repair endonuclease
VTRSEARELGLSDQQIARRVRSGRWVRHSRDAFTLAGVPLTRMTRLAATVAAGGVVASHRSAAGLHGLTPVPVRPEVSAATSRAHGQIPARLHRTADLLERDVQTVSGIRCTRPARTLVDLGARLDEPQLARLVDKALHLRLTTVDELIGCLLRLARRGRDGIAVSRAVISGLDPAVVPSESDLETLLGRVLADYRLPLPTRQFETVVGGRPVRLDFAYPDRKIAIESDGFAVHGLRSAFEDDRARQNLLVLDGWVVLRFTWRQICEQPEWVAAQVRTALQRNPV